MPTTPSPAARPPEPADPRRARRDRRVALVLALAALVGAAALVASGVVFGPDDEPEPTGAPVPQGPDAPLHAADAAPRPIPPGAVDVVVVTRDGGEPVEDAEVALLATLARDGGAPSHAARTDATGRARLVGELPGFVTLASGRFDAEPRVVATTGGREVRFEVVARPATRAFLLDAATGLPAAGFLLSPDGVAGEPPRTDGQGVVTWAAAARTPAIVAASDGRRRVAAFVLHRVPGRADVRLAMPTATRATTVRALDVEGRAVAGARAYVGTEATGVAVDLDDRGEAVVEHGERDAVTLVVVARGFSPRRVELDGRPEVVAVLEPTTARAIRVRRADGSDAPDGTTVAGWSLGPARYGRQGTGRTFAGTTAGGVARVEELPSGAFEADVEVTGPDLWTWATVRAGADPAAPLEVTASAGRTLRLQVARPSGDPAADDLVVVHAPRRGGCSDAPEARRRALDEAVREGRADGAFGGLRALVGPEVEVALPAADGTVGVEVLGPAGTLACVAVAPGDGGGARDVRLAPAGAAAAEATTVVLAEWEDGTPAALADLLVTREEQGATPTHATTDASGAAFVEAVEGRFRVETTRPDGARFVADAPLLLPARGTPLLRLRPAAR